MMVVDVFKIITSMILMVMELIMVVMVIMIMTVSTFRFKTISFYRFCFNIFGRIVSVDLVFLQGVNVTPIQMILVSPSVVSNVCGGVVREPPFSQMVVFWK